MKKTKEREDVYALDLNFGEEIDNDEYSYNPCDINFDAKSKSYTLIDANGEEIR